MNISNIMRVLWKIQFFVGGIGVGRWGGHKKTIYTGELLKKGLTSQCTLWVKGFSCSTLSLYLLVLDMDAKEKKKMLKLNTFKFSKCPEISLLGSSSLIRPFFKVFSIWTTSYFIKAQTLFLNVFFVQCLQICTSFRHIC